MHGHAGRMLAVARRFLRCEADAADAVQEAFLSAFRSLHTFGGNCRLGTWLHRIVANVCLMKLRAARSRPAVSIEALAAKFDDGRRESAARSLETPPDRLAVSELRARVRERIEALPEAYRTVLLMRDIEELSTWETSERLRITPSAVKVRLHRARRALRALLAPVLPLEADQGWRMAQ